MKRTAEKAGSLVIGCLWLAAAAAQSQGVTVGDATVYPSLGVTLGYDDNITLSSGDAVSSFFYQVSPGIRWQGGDARSRVAVAYAIDHAVYRDSDFDDYSDHSLTADWTYDPTVRSTFDLSGSYLRGHDSRGEGVREFVEDTLPLDVDRYQQIGLDGAFTYGANGATGQLRLDAGLSRKRYRNNRELTRIADYDQQRLGAEFSWRLAPKTRLVVDAGIVDQDYSEDARDGDQTSLGLGLAWDATARTDGRASVRYLDTEFDDGSPGYEGEAWEIALRWAPKTYSVVELSTSRETDVAFGQSTFLVRDSFNVSWRHEWRAHFATFVDAGLEQEDFDPGTRDDEGNYYGLGFSYRVRDWLNVGFSYRHTNRDSSRPQFDYDRARYLLSFEIAP